MTDHDPSPHHDVHLAVPRRWATHADPDQGIVLAARAPTTPASGFAPELVLRTAPVVGDPAMWRVRALAALGPELDRFEVEDTDELELGGHSVDYRRFGHRVGGIDVVCDQWVWIVGAIGLTLTGSVARVDYADYCDVFEEVAATVEISPAARPGSAHRGEGRS